MKSILRYFMASVVLLAVSVNGFAGCATTGSTFNDETCAGTPYNFNGRILTSSGVYFDTLSNVQGCDSIVTLNLTVNQKSIVDVYDTICAGTIYYFAGIKRTVSGIYGDTLFNVHFCDSIITLHLEVNNNPHPRDTIFASICQGSTYQFYGRTIGQPGTYRDTVAGSNHGCDSIIVLRLSIIGGGGPGGGTNINASICTGASYNFNGTLLTVAGTYRDTLTSSFGCDSIIRLTLTVGQYTTINLRDSICAAGGTYAFHGRTLTGPGTYRDTITTGSACDSIYVLRLVAKAGSAVNVNASICNGGSYTFHGVTYTTPGIHRDTVASNTGGCDTVFTLTLTPGQPPQINKTDSICAGDPYVYRGKTYTLTGNYRDTIPSTTAGVCDTIINLRLVALSGSPAPYTVRDSFCQGGTYHFRDTFFTTSGPHRIGLAGPGCDTVVNVILTYRTALTPATITKSGNTLIANVSGTVTYQWYLDGAPISGATGQAYTATESGSYTVETSEGAGCSILSNPYQFTLTGIETITKGVLRLYPNPNTGLFTVQTRNAAGTEAIVSDLSGRIVSEFVITQERQPVNLQNLSSGAYLIYLRNSSEKPLRFNIVK